MYILRTTVRLSTIEFSCRTYYFPIDEKAASTPAENSQPAAPTL